MPILGDGLGVMVGNIGRGVLPKAGTALLKVSANVLGNRPGSVQAVNRVAANVAAINKNPKDWNALLVEVLY
jgi:ribosomal protein S5